MTQYNTFNVKLSNSQLNKLKLGMKNGTEITCSTSSSNKFLQMLLVILLMKVIFRISCYQINTQVSKLCKTFGNGSSANIR